MHTRFLAFSAAWVCSGSFMSGCRSLNDPNAAPALGTIGGITVGALVGSISGDVDTGAFIGGMLGRSGGEIVRTENTQSGVHLLNDLPKTLKAADRFDALVASDYSALASRRATSPTAELPQIKAIANHKLKEIQAWIGILNSSDAALSTAISNATTSGSNHLGTWLNQRNELRSSLASLKMHQSWFKTLAS